MTKFTTLSQHIGDANHLYEVGEPREIDEPGNAQHLFRDKVLGPYDEAAEKTWLDGAEARAKAQPATKVDADNSLATLSDSKATFGAEIEGLKSDFEAARGDLTAAHGTIATLTQNLDVARSDLTAAHATIATLTHERDAARSELDDAVVSRGIANGDLQAAQATIAELTTERDALKSAAKPHTTKPK